MKTGVVRKFSLTHWRRKGNDVSTSLTEYATLSEPNSESLLLISSTHLSRVSGLCSKFQNSNVDVALVVCVPAILF